MLTYHKNFVVGDIIKRHDELVEKSAHYLILEVYRGPDGECLYSLLELEEGITTTRYLVTTSGITIKKVA